MRILITGGCGFLGSNLAAAALRRGHEVIVIDAILRVGGQDNLAWLRSLGQVPHYPIDVADATSVSELVRLLCPQVVFHLAGQVAMTTSISDPRRDFATNAQGTFNVLEAVRAHAPDALVVYSSTNKVFGDLEQFTYRETETRWECVERPNGFDESTPLSFHSPYGCSKGCADQYMLDWHRMFGLKTVVFRHSSMYGGRQYATEDQGWIGWFVRQAIAVADNPDREPFSISGNGKQVRDVLHAEDMVDLYFRAVDRAEAAAGKAFCIGGGMSNSLSLLELFAILEREVGVSLAYKRLPARSSDQRVFVADISKAERILGWVPRIKVQDGLRRMIGWVREACG